MIYIQSKNIKNSRVFHLTTLITEPFMAVSVSIEPVAVFAGEIFSST